MSKNQKQLSRRAFHETSMAVVGGSVLGGSQAVGARKSAFLPTVRWGEHDISRLLVGHNPPKGGSHFGAELDAEMREFFDDENVHGRELLDRCEQLGINTCQIGAPSMEDLLRSHYSEGGNLQWIASFYAKPGKVQEELDRILTMEPRPIGAQLMGVTVDRMMLDGQIDKARDILKMLRDAGLLVGFCSHNHEVIDYVEERGWDVDFYQCCFYRVSYSLHEPRERYNDRRYEIFEEEARHKMVKTIQQVSKPCMAYKVLASNRHCHTPEMVRRALHFTFANIKPNDVVLLGMWQKHKDQVAENVAFVREFLG